MFIKKMFLFNHNYIDVNFFKNNINLFIKIHRTI